MNKDFVKKIIAIQSELKCNKSKRNTFAEFNYRSCEDIFESIKPFLVKHELTLFISDSIELFNGFTYIKATVTITDGDNRISTDGWAKEPELKKKLDSSQVSGSTSTYARKYALSGMFLIDDSVDPDSMDNSDNSTKISSLPQRPSTLRNDNNSNPTNPTESQKIKSYLARINQLTKDMTPSQKEDAIRKASFDSDGYLDDINAMTKNGVKLNSNQLLELGRKLAENLKEVSNV